MSETLGPQRLGSFCLWISVFSFSWSCYFLLEACLTNPLCTQVLWFLSTRLILQYSVENNPKSRFCLELSQMFIVYYMQGTLLNQGSAGSNKTRDLPSDRFQNSESGGCTECPVWPLLWPFVAYIVIYSYKVFWSFKGTSVWKNQVIIMAKV